MKLRAPDELNDALSRELVGQPDALGAVLPFIQMYQAGLALEGRPAGIFLLLGPTGTGKTRTVEALARVLHGDYRKLLQVNCGELQADHEIAKLVGAPPGYIGHRETRPLLTQAALEDVTSEACDLALVLFDEVEKAAASLMPLLLGTFDKGLLQLGDGTTVDFSRSLIFLTSNLGAREMMRELGPGLGFQTAARDTTTATRLESIALTAVRKRFSPELVNRLDAIVTYKPLDAEALDAILTQQIDSLRHHVQARLGKRAFRMDVTSAARGFLLDAGTSAEYGARELKRTVQRHLTQPLALMVASGHIAPGCSVSIDTNDGAGGLAIVPESAGTIHAVDRPTVLVVEPNRDLSMWLGRVLGDHGYSVVLAHSAEQARAHLCDRQPDAVLVDVDNADCVPVALSLLELSPPPRLAIMTADVRRRPIGRDVDVPVLRKPFLSQDVVAVFQDSLDQAPVPRLRELRAS